MVIWKTVVKNHADCVHNYSEVGIKRMPEFLIDNFYLIFGISMDTNCVPLSADLNVFLYSYEAEFVWKSVREK